MAKPIYTVVVTFQIGEYLGDWTGREVKMPAQYTIACKSPNKKLARLRYKRLVTAALSYRAVTR